MRGPNRIARLIFPGASAAGIACCGTGEAGEVSSNVDGTVSSGYSADYGNMTGSDHGWAVGGDLNYPGSFYNPNFLSFNATLYLNQSRANSDSQSISNASGVDASANIFGGSHFPGSVSYSKAYNSEGNYDVPGLANYVTHGNNDAFGINWSENVAESAHFRWPPSRWAAASIRCMEPTTMGIAHFIRSICIRAIASTGLT